MTSWLFAVAVLALAGCSRKADAPAPTPAPAAAVAAPAPGQRAQRGDRRNPVDPNAPKFSIKVGDKSWTQDDFDKVARYTTGNDGEGRDVWSLRELAHALGGPTARIAVVVGVDGKKPIDKAAWDDPTRTPLVHTTRRNTLKMVWADAKGTWGETDVKDVTALELATP